MRAAPTRFALVFLLFAAPLRAEPLPPLMVSEQWLLAHLLAPFVLSCPIASGPTGIVVAVVELEAGQPWAGAEVLEAPSLALAECVQRSLLALRYRRPEGKSGQRYRAKVILYAMERAGKSIELVPATRMSVHTPARFPPASPTGVAP